MDPLIMGLIGLSAIFVLVVLGMRIAFATALVGFVGLWIMKNFGVAGNVLGFLPHAIVAHLFLKCYSPFTLSWGSYAFYCRPDR